MPTITIEFETGPPCSGGNHFDVNYSLKVDGNTLKSRTFRTDKSEIIEPLRGEELDDFMGNLLQLLAEQRIGGDGLAANRRRLESTVVDITLADDPGGT